MAHRDDPTIARLNTTIGTATRAQIDDHIDALDTGDAEKIADWLGIDLDDYYRHPIAGEAVVLAHIANRLGLDGGNLLDHHRMVAIAEAWFDAAATGEDYVFARIGLERQLEDWLVADPTPIIRRVGQAVRLSSRQFLLPDRRRPDLVYDLVDGDEVTGTVIVELKAVQGYREAVDQIVGYVDAFEEHGLGNGDQLFGMLIADGFPPEVLDYARERDIDVATLSELGYRRGLGFL